MYDIHPFTCPFDDNLKLVKPYTEVELFEDEYNINYTWHLSDNLNAMTDGGLYILCTEEMEPEKDHDWPLRVSMDEIME